MPEPKELIHAIQEAELERYEWSWPVQIKLTDDHILIRPMHLNSRLSDTYTIDADALPEYKITHPPQPTEPTVTITQLEAWATQRMEEANRGYSHDGRSGYGDIEGAIDVCRELIEWCGDLAPYDGDKNDDA